MARKTFSTSDAPQPVASYSQASQVGDLVAVAGQVGTRPSTGGIVSDAVGAQTEQALANVQAVLEAAGCGLDDVLRVDCYLTDPGDLAEFNEVYARWFATEPPARTTVFVGLAVGLKVEITALAVVPGRG